MIVHCQTYNIAHTQVQQKGNYINSSDPTKDNGAPLSVINIVNDNDNE